MLLTEVEAAFKCLKSELTIRPVHHQKEYRVEAHTMVALLGYCLMATLKQILRPTPGLTPGRCSMALNWPQNGNTQTTAALLPCSGRWQGHMGVLNRTSANPVFWLETVSDREKSLGPGWQAAQGQFSAIGRCWTSW